MIRVYTDHKKVTYKTHNSACVMRWRLLTKEFGPELIYLPGVKNVVADYLSRLKYKNNDNPTDHFALNKEDVNAYSLSYKLIVKYQQKDSELLQKNKKHNTYALRTFTTAGCTRTLIKKDD